MTNEIRSRWNQEITNSFVDGYRKGCEDTEQKLINKVCDWLKKTLYIHTEYIEDKQWGVVDTIDWITSDYDSVEDFIENFRKSMEE